MIPCSHAQVKGWVWDETSLQATVTGAPIGPMGSVGEWPAEQHPNTAHGIATHVLSVLSPFMCCPSMIPVYDTDRKACKVASSPLPGSALGTARGRQ